VPDWGGVLENWLGTALHSCQVAQNSEKIRTYIS